MIFPDIHFKHVSLFPWKLRNEEVKFIQTALPYHGQCTKFLLIKSCAIKFLFCVASKYLLSHQNRHL